MRKIDGKKSFRNQDVIDHRQRWPDRPDLKLQWYRETQHRLKAKPTLTAEELMWLESAPRRIRELQHEVSAM